MSEGRIMQRSVRWLFFGKTCVFCLIYEMGLARKRGKHAFSTMKAAGEKLDYSPYNDVTGFLVNTYTKTGYHEI